VAISLRFAEAQSMRKPKPATDAGFEDPWNPQMAELEATQVG
jgi:hypothetical protein